MSNQPCPLSHRAGAKHVNFLSGFPNSYVTAQHVFSHRLDVTSQRLGLLGMNVDAMREILSIDAWAEWIRSQDTAWLFLLILALVVAVVAVWSSTLQPDNSRKPEKDKSGT